MIAVATKEGICTFFFKKKERIVKTSDQNGIIDGQCSNQASSLALRKRRIANEVSVHLFFGLLQALHSLEFHAFSA